MTERVHDTKSGKCDTCRERTDRRTASRTVHISPQQVGHLPGCTSRDDADLCGQATSPDASQELRDGKQITADAGAKVGAVAERACPTCVESDRAPVPELGKWRKRGPFIGIFFAMVGATLWYWRYGDTALTVYGALVSSIGVLLAWAIYDRQFVESAKAARRSDDSLASSMQQAETARIAAANLAEERRLNAADRAERLRIASEERTFERLGQLAPLVDLIPVMLGALGGDDKEDELADPYATESEWLTTHGNLLSGEYNTIPASKIPTQVSKDLAAGWDANPNQTAPSGAELTTRLEAALRKRGKGNFAWFVIVRGDDESGEFRIFRVSKGGQAKDTPTTTEVTDRSVKFLPFLRDVIATVTGQQEKKGLIQPDSVASGQAEVEQADPVDEEVGE